MQGYGQSTGKRKAVQRLLAGERNAYDVFQICSWMRTRHGNNIAVREFGDFLHHSDERKQGNAFEIAKDFYTTVAFSTRFDLALKGGDSSNLPQLDRDFANRHIKAIKKNVSDDWIKNELAINRKEFNKNVDDLLNDNLWDIDHGGIVKTSISADHFSLYDRLAGMVCSNFNYDSEILKNQYFDALLQEGLIKITEKNTWEDNFQYFTAFLVPTMHMCKMFVLPGISAELFIKLPYESSKEGIGIWIAADIGQGKMNSTCVFQTNLSPDEWCSAHLNKLRPIQKHLSLGASYPDWAPEIPAIELTPSGIIDLVEIE